MGAAQVYSTTIKFNDYKMKYMLNNPHIITDRAGNPVEPHVLDHLRTYHEYSRENGTDKTLRRIKEHYFPAAYHKVPGRLVVKVVTPSKGDRPVSIGAATMNRKIRATLFGGIYHDIDIKNCHPTLLAAFCERNNFSFPTLAKYVEDPAKMREKVSHGPDGENDTAHAKSMIHSVLNGGGERFRDPFLAQMRLEFRGVAEKIYNTAPQHHRQRAKTKAHDWNIHGSCVALVIQEIEGRCIRAMVQYCKRTEGVELGATIHDGALIMRGFTASNGSVPELLAAITRYIEQETTYEVTLVEKPLTGGYNIPPPKGDTPYITVPDPPAEETDETEYAIMKKHMESDRQLTCIMAAHRYLVDGDFDRKLFSRDELREYFQSTLLDRGTRNERLFVNEWLKDETKQKFDHMGFYPPGTCPPDTLTLWRGYACESLPTAPPDTNIKPFHDILRDLCGGQEVAYEYVLKWLAYLFQFPEKKPIVALAFTSLEGCFKSQFWDLIQSLVGPEMSRETGDAKKDLFEKHSAYLENRKLIVVNETSFDVTKQYHEVLKSMITDTAQTVRGLYQKSRVIHSLVGLVFLTNSRTPVTITDTDRRYVLFRASGKYRNDTSYFTGVWKPLVERKEARRAIYDMLMAVDLSEFDIIRERPETDAYTEARQNCLPTIIKWCEDTVVRNFPQEWEAPEGTSTAALIRSFARFLPQKAERPSAMKFCGMMGQRITERGFDRRRVTSGEHKGKYRWFVDRDACFEWLLANKYTPADSELEPVIPTSHYGDF